MPTRSKASTPVFMDESEIRDILIAMQSDMTMTTESGYSAGDENYPDHLQVPFIEKHLAYLKSHPKINPKDYLSNLRIMIRIRH